MRGRILITISTLKTKNAQLSDCRIVGNRGLDYLSTKDYISGVSNHTSASLYCIFGRTCIRFVNLIEIALLNSDKPTIPTIPTSLNLMCLQSTWGIVHGE